MKNSHCFLFTHALFKYNFILTFLRLTGQICPVKNEDKIFILISKNYIIIEKVELFLWTRRTLTEFSYIAWNMSTCSFHYVDDTYLTCT